MSVSLKESNLICCFYGLNSMPEFLDLLPFSLYAPKRGHHCFTYKRPVLLNTGCANCSSGTRKLYRFLAKYNISCSMKHPSFQSCPEFSIFVVYQFTPSLQFLRKIHQRNLIGKSEIIDFFFGSCRLSCILSTRGVKFSFR
jgi:hypothetical protein